MRPGRHNQRDPESIAGWLTHDEDDDVKRRDEERGRGRPHELSETGGRLGAEDTPPTGASLHRVGVGVLQGGREGVHEDHREQHHAQRQARLVHQAGRGERLQDRAW